MMGAILIMTTLSKSTPFALYHRPTLRSTEFILKRGDLRTLPGAPHIVRVIGGSAWITHGQQDIILKAGQETTLYPGEFVPLISPVGEGDLVYEVIV